MSARHSAQRRWLAAVIVVLVAADWLTKLWVLNRVAVGETLAVVEGWLYLAHRRNTGVAFGLLADLPAPWAHLALAAMSLVAIVLFLQLLPPAEARASRLAVAFVVAGALGNLGDRLAHGSVTDFLLLAFFPFVFNLADALITAGAGLLILRLRGGVDARPTAA